MAIRATNSSNRIETALHVGSSSRPNYSFCIDLIRNGSGGGNSGRIFDADNLFFYLPSASEWRLNYQLTGSNAQYALPNADATGTLYRFALAIPVGASSAPTAYLNGSTTSVVENAAGAGSARTDSAAMVLFNRSTADRGFDGDIQRVAFWDELLSDEELESLSNGVSPALIRPASRFLWIEDDGTSIYDRQGASLTITGLSLIDNFASVLGPDARLRSQLYKAPAGVTFNASGVATSSDIASGDATVAISLPGAANSEDIATGAATAEVGLSAASLSFSTATGAAAVDITATGHAFSEDFTTGDATTQTSDVFNASGVAISSDFATGNVTVGLDAAGLGLSNDLATGDISAEIAASGYALSENFATGDVTTNQENIFNASGVASSSDFTVGNVSITQAASGVGLNFEFATGDALLLIATTGNALSNDLATGDATTEGDSIQFAASGVARSSDFATGVAAAAIATTGNSLSSSLGTANAAIAVTVSGFALDSSIAYSLVVSGDYSKPLLVALARLPQKPILVGFSRIPQTPLVTTRSRSPQKPAITLRT